MEQSEIISSTITAVTTLLVAGSAFFVGRYNSKHDKTSTILEEQYLKVISPIHRALKCLENEDVIDAIEKVVVENYHLLPDGLYDDYINYKNGKKSSSSFKKKINEFNRILRYKLGYSKIKITKQDKEAEKQLANSKNHTIIIFLLILALFFFVGLFLFIIFSDTKLNSKEFNELSFSIFAVIITILIELISIISIYTKRK